MDNFEELKKKVAAYPNSSLFVPLAEEYNKRGELEEAINVLKRGLERQPTYTTARVALSKLYLVVGNREGAVQQLEQVVASVPDNFFALRKLAEAYCQMKRKDDAIGMYKRILEINPEDEEAVSALNGLMSGKECVTEDESPVAAELEALSAPEPEVSGVDLDSTMVMGSSLAAGQSVHAPKAVAPEAPVEEVPSEEVEVFAGEADIEEDMSIDVAGDYDMGGVEFEPDGVYGDEELGEVAVRDEDAGIDIGVEVAYGSNEEPAPLPVEHVESIEDDPLIPAGGDPYAVSGEYSGRSLVEDYGSPGADIPTAPGLETFEGGEYGTADDKAGAGLSVPPEADQTTLMVEPLAGMVEPVAEPVVEATPEEDRTMVMSAPDWAQEPEAAPVVEPVAEPVAEATPEEDRTMVMSAPDWAQEPVAEPVVEPVTEPEIITAEPGTILEDSPALEPEHLINDPLGGGQTAMAEPAAKMDTGAEAPDAQEKARIADEHIAAGDYGKAMQVYSSMLAGGPGDAGIKMKMQELSMLLNVTGQGADVYRQRLEAFGQAIKRRVNELR